VHIGADEHHAEVGAGMLRRHAADGPPRAAVLATARQCADALWSFLDGVEGARAAAPAGTGSA
ncbi:MAG: hypothetical protein ACYDCT_13755, partial [Dehalococcoidia bacterium]